MLLDLYFSVEMNNIKEQLDKIDLIGLSCIMISAKYHDLLWKLLVNISPKDILFLYWYDKEQFYKTYDTWDDSMKDWVIETISNNI